MCGDGTAPYKCAELHNRGSDVRSCTIVVRMCGVAPSDISNVRSCILVRNYPCCAESCVLTTVFYQS